MGSSRKSTHYTYVRNSFERDEFIKCKMNPIYFINKYVWITHPKYGKIPFKMYPFQMSLLMVYLSQAYNVCLKPRQMGISTLVAAYALWLALFHEHKYILIISIKQSVARSLLRRIKFMYLNLPDFLKVEIVNGGRDTAGTADAMRFKNFSEIQVQASTDDAGRSDSLSCLIMDEVAFQRHASTTWGAAQQTLATGGQAILLSTAFGVGNFFHETYLNALQGSGLGAGTNGFYPVRLKWQMHPNRDMDWYAKQAMLLGSKRLAQEIDCNFLQSGFNVFDMAKIRAIEERLNERDPVIERYDGQLKQYWLPVAGEQYFIGGDVASGRARDFSTFSIMNGEGKEYACFKGKIGLREFAYLLGDMGLEYNNAIVAPESNAIGEGVIATLQENGYPNLYHTVSKTLKLDAFEHDERLIAGWLTTGKSRHEIITGMDDDLSDELIELWNPFFVKEANTFIYNEANKPIALGKDKGVGGIRSSNMYEDESAVVYTDDSIIGACITNEIRKAPHKFRGQMPFMTGA